MAFKGLKLVGLIKNVYLYELQDKQHQNNTATETKILTALEVAP